MLTSVFALAVGVFWPEADSDDRYTYEVVQPVRTFLRWWLFAGAVNLVVGVTALALGGWLLVRERGAGLATVGAALMWIGCAPYAVGVGGIAAAYYFGTEPAALDAAASTRLLDHLADDFLSVWGPAIAGALLVALGQVLLAVALWRAGTVPRWIPVVLATIPVTFVLDTTGVLGLLVELPMALGAVGVAWALWRRTREPDRSVASSSPGATPAV